MEENLKLRNAIKILNILNEKGFEAYIVGGYVRDRLLGIESKDIDITTNALPSVVQELFPSNFSKSLKYQTVNVILDEIEYEITTYRVDLSYKDHRHPESKVSSSLKSDLKRRDFTVNAMCMDKDQKIIDYVGGKEDLENKILRTVGIPRKRFNEDALRMFRAFRFASRLGFTIDSDTYEGIKKNASLIKYVSKERIKDELTGILLAPYLKDNLVLINNSGIFKLYPGLKTAFMVLERNYYPTDFVSLTALSSYLLGDLSEELLMSKKERKTVRDTLHFIELFKDKKATPFSFIDYEYQPIEYAILIMKILDMPIYNNNEIKEMYEAMPIKNMKDLSINGDDIKKYLNLSDSPLIKTYLNKAASLVIYDHIPNEKEILLKKLGES